MNEPLQEWFNNQRENTPDEMYYKKASWSQIMFARDKLCGLISAGIEDYEKRRDVVTVISEHKSKSVRLPVYSFDRPDIGLRIIARDNFYDWKISVISDTPIIADFSGLFHTNPPIDPEYTGDPLHSVYFEGFPKELVFGYYETNQSKWSAEIGNDYELWAVLFLIMKAKGQIKPFMWSTRNKD
jgi:hypothetical protein